MSDPRREPAPEPEVCGMTLQVSTETVRGDRLVVMTVGTDAFWVDAPTARLMAARLLQAAEETERGGRC